MSISAQPSDSSSKITRKPVSKRVRFEVLRRDDYTCRYCRSTENPLTIDHVVPTVLGGSDDPSNLVAACKDCNAGKSSISPDAPLVEDVQEDAFRWGRAMQAAQELAEVQARRGEEVCAKFEAHWRNYHYQGTTELIPLPFDWRPRLLDLVRGPGLTGQDLMESIDLAMGARQARDEFAYCIGVLRNKLAARQMIARQMIDEGRF